MFENTDAESNRRSLVQRGQAFIQARRELVSDRLCLEIMIMACISEGYITRDEIIRTVPKFVGHSYAHVAALLDASTGPNPEEHFCYRDDNNNYQVHGMPRHEFSVSNNIKKNKRKSRPAGRSTTPLSDDRY